MGSKVKCNCVYNKGRGSYLKMAVSSDAEYKIVLLGDPGVGKTTWFMQVRQGEFVDTDNTIVSMGVDHLEHKISVDGKEVKVCCSTNIA